MVYMCVASVHKCPRVEDGIGEPALSLSLISFRQGLDALKQAVASSSELPVSLHTDTALGLLVLHGAVPS